MECVEVYISFIATFLGIHLISLRLESSPFRIITTFLHITQTKYANHRNKNKSAFSAQHFDECEIKIFGSECKCCICECECDFTPMSGSIYHVCHGGIEPSNRI